MNSILMSLVTFGCITIGTLIGIQLGRILPVHHLSSESKDTIKMASGFVATMAALVLGLLVASAKNTFDTVNSEVTQTGAKIIMLNHVLAKYGPEAQPIREDIRQNLAWRIQQIWPETVPGKKATEVADLSLNTPHGMDQAEEALNQLAPQTDSQRLLLGQARQMCSDILMARWLVVEQSQTGLPTVFIIVLLSWFTMLFIGLGLLAPRNKTVLVALFFCNLSFSTAIFLISEMDHPLSGMMKISSAPLQQALMQLGKP